MFCPSGALRPLWMSSTEFRLSLLDSVVRSARRLCEGELCSLRHRRNVNTLCLLYEIYHCTDHPLHMYLNNFVAARTRAAAALFELALVIPRCRTDQFSRSLLHVAWRRLDVPFICLYLLELQNNGPKECYELMPTEGLVWFFPSHYFDLFLLFYSLRGIMVLGPFFIGGVYFPSFACQVILIIIN